jgi:hypothetical protein
MDTKREIAKFAAGVTAWEALVHLSFALAGVLPLRLFGITLTKRVNAIQIVVPALSSLLLACYAWGRR